MAVSLKKPEKVDLSKSPLEKPLREITPEHLTEEYTPFTEKIITPVHIASEQIPPHETADTPKQDKVKQTALYDAPLRKAPFTVHFDLGSLFMLIASIALLVVLVCVLVNIDGAEFATDTQNTFRLAVDILTELPVIQFALAFIFGWIGFKAIKSIFDMNR